MATTISVTRDLRGGDDAILVTRLGLGELVLEIRNPKLVTGHDGLTLAQVNLSREQAKILGDELWAGLFHSEEG